MNAEPAMRKLTAVTIVVVIVNVVFCDNSILIRKRCSSKLISWNISKGNVNAHVTSIHECL